MKNRDQSITLLNCAAICDARGLLARPGALALNGDGRVLAAGPPAAVAEALAGAAVKTIDLRDRVLLPGMVNAHAHLELTDAGPIAYPGTFPGWVTEVRRRFPGRGDPWRRQPGADYFEAAAKTGLAMLRESGVRAVGDITQHPAVAAARATSAIEGASFIELFGIGAPFDEPGVREIEAGAHGLQPHAPYSAGPRLYDAAARSGRPVSTHLAETQDELRFVARGDGPCLDLLEKLGKWAPAFAKDYGRNQSPVEWMRPHLEKAPWLLAHCNYVSDADIALLAQTGASVAYCPVASDYFGHTGHRYRDLLAAGVNVCIGTDSICCQRPDDPQPLGVLGQVRYLLKRDAADPLQLLKMATTSGLRALGLDERDGLFEPGARPRPMAVRIDPHAPADPLVQALSSEALAEAVGAD